MEKKKHVPLRMCIACREMKTREELFRLTVSDKGLPITDSTGRNVGRGAYLCKQADCIKKAQKAGRIGRALRCRDDAGLYEALTAECLP